MNLSSAEAVGAEERVSRPTLLRRRNIVKPMKTVMKKKLLAILSLALFAAAAYSKSPERLDFYDYSGNHLMFVTFEYEDQKNVSRTVYMSDSTFVRKVFITYDLQGKRVRESSLNFNSDTSFLSDYQYRGDTTAFSIKDMFGNDQMGGRVRYLTNDSSRFSFSYQNPQNPGSSVSYSISYSYNNEGDPASVVVSNHVPEETYYGVFNYDISAKVNPGLHQIERRLANVRMRSARLIDVSFNLEKPSQVKCALISLSGRRAATLFEARVGPGAHLKTLRAGQGGGLSRLAEGVYVFIVSIDGAMVIKSKYLLQHCMSGGVQ